MLQLSPSLFPFATSWAGSICLGFLAQLMNGHSACFATFLARSLQHASIKVYLSGVRALHIEQGFAGRLQNCLRLKCVIRGIKRSQGTPSSSRLPIRDDLTLVIWRSLDLQLPDHACFGQHALWGILGFFVQRNSQCPCWRVFYPQFTWAYRTSQWTPLQTPCAFVSSSKLQRQILSARAAPFILAGASTPYTRFKHWWCTW